MYVFVLDISRIYIYIYIHISSYFKTSPTKYQYTFSLHTGLQIPLLKVRFVLDKGCSDIILKKKTFIFPSNKLTDFNKIIICINSKQIQTNNEKGQKALGRRKKSNRLNDMCRVTAWK